MRTRSSSPSAMDRLHLNVADSAEEDLFVLVLHPEEGLHHGGLADTGATKSAALLSVPEGDDKPYKYPGMYRGVDALIINKTDLLPYIDFDMDYFRHGVEVLNPGLEVERRC